eukprot:13828160-Alexandrium_andersonii.AAC.1
MRTPLSRACLFVRAGCAVLVDLFAPLAPSLSGACRGVSAWQLRHEMAEGALPLPGRPAFPLTCRLRDLGSILQLYGPVPLSPRRASCGARRLAPCDLKT